MSDMNADMFVLAVFSLFLSLGQGDEVCYDNIGCFRNTSPFNNAQGKLPKSPEHIRTNFLYQSRKNQTLLLNENNNFNEAIAGYDPHLKSVFIVHGFHSRSNNAWISSLVNALLAKDDLNIIIVDWSGGSFDSYDQAVANTRVVGAVIAELINRLHNVSQLNMSQVHLIGHSLGAHICGYAGERIQGLGRITGLDPAGPFFQLVDVSVRLDPSDANFVDVIHTDAKHYGLSEAIGHVDFFPNGGVHQPGCTTDNLDPSIACSHVRAIYYFISSIDGTCHFQSYPCESKNLYDTGGCTACGKGCQEMGYQAVMTYPGQFYLRTGWHYPFC